MLRRPAILLVVLLLIRAPSRLWADHPRSRDHPRAGVPPVPRSLFTALNRYQNIRGASFQDWDDTRPRAMYITTRFAETPQVHHVAAPGGARRQLTFSTERAFLTAFWRGPGTTSSSMPWTKAGPRIYQLFLQDRTGGEPRRITDGKSRNIAPAWSPTGELLAWSSKRPNGRDTDLYLVAAADPHFQRRLKEVSGQWTVDDWSPDGTSVVAEEYISINESYIHIVDINTGRTTTITPRRVDPKAEPVSSGDAKWSPDGRSIYYLGDKESEFRRLFRHDLLTGSDTLITGNIPWDVESFDVSDDGQHIALVANENGVDVLHGYHAATDQELANAQGLTNARD